MAKLTTADGSVFEGTVVELAQMVKEFEVCAEEKAQAPKVIEGDPQVGDKIRIVDAYSPSGTYKNGDIFTVKSIGYSNQIYVKEHGTFIYRREFEIIERNSCVSHERPSKPALQVGDYAKVVDDNNIYNDHSIKAGEIVEIIKDDDSTVPYRMKSVTSGVTLWAKSKHIVKATDEEVSEAKRKLAEKEEAAKWAAIGRKPNEYKAGDIVEVIEKYERPRDVGEFFEVTSVRFSNMPADSNGYIYYVGPAGDTVKLITPVEHRFDK